MPFQFLFPAIYTAHSVADNGSNNIIRHVKVAMGGGFANTELRSLSDARVFEFFDFITLDDGEAPIENLIEHIEG